MACANDHYFTDPKLRAEQEQYARGFAPSGGRIQGGIGRPQEDKVRAGSWLFRFGHSGKSDDENLSSSWWLRQDGFNEIVARARRSGTDLIEMSRIKNAVPHQFGPADVIYVVDVREPLRVFTGRGRPVVEEATTAGSIAGRIFPGGFEIAQLFIPGLREAGPVRRPSLMARRALLFVRKDDTLAYIVNQAARNAAGLAQLERDLPPGGRLPIGRLR